MHRPLALIAVTAITGLGLGALAPSPAEGDFWWVKFLFTPQAGLNSACLTCGWHSVCVDPYPWGPALDFGGACSDGGQQVYFRNFGFKPSGSMECVAWGTPFRVPGITCKTTEVRIFDTNINYLGTMRYVHTYKTRDADMMMHINEYGYKNEYVFAGMAKDPDEDQGIPENEKENEECKRQGYWTGVHLHELHVNQEMTFYLRNDGDCGETCEQRFPCAPEPAPCYYDPQDWWNDWVRGFEWSTGDADEDDFTDGSEMYMGTDPFDDCADGSWDDAWPPDFDNNTVVDVTDALMFLAHYPSAPGDPRYDMNADGVIDITDALIFSPYLPSTCA
jgi:hypothetical protein